jgi:hypothetical protein
MKYKLIAHCDEISTRKWKTLEKLFTFGEIQKFIDYIKRRCSVDGEVVEKDIETDSDELVYEDDKYIVTYRDFMCGQVFLYERV